MGGHVYVVEFHRAPDDLATFARLVDETLQAGNEDYATHRTYGLLAPVVEPLPGGTFGEFLRRRGEIGGQHEVPRVLGDEQLQELLAAAERAQAGCRGRIPQPSQGWSPTGTPRPGARLPLAEQGSVRTATAHECGGT